MRSPEFLSIETVVVGGGIAGLISAIALSRAGHEVILFEQGDDIEDTVLAGGARIPPNMSKILYRWGMEKTIREQSVSCEGICFVRYETGLTLGGQTLDQDMLDETGGDFLLMHYGVFRRMLYDSAVEHGVTVRRKAKVVAVTPAEDRPSVTLETGEVVEADMIIGADGLLGVTRKTVIEDGETLKYVGQNMWNVVIPEEGIRADPSLEFLLARKVRDLESAMAYNWFSENGYGVMGFAVEYQGQRLFSLFVYTPGPPDQDLTKVVSTPEKLLEALATAEPRLRKLASMATAVTFVPMAESPHLEDWVHPDGRVLVIGEGAHPLQAGSLYSMNMAAGDATTLGRLFQHLHRKDQIDSFLSAVQEIRQKRVDEVIREARRNVLAMALPAGAEHGDLQGKSAMLGNLGNIKEDTTDMLQHFVQDIFAYDPEDEADSWWVQWGLMQERAARTVHLNLEVNADVNERVSQSPPKSQ